MPASACCSKDTQFSLPLFVQGTAGHYSCCSFFLPSHICKEPVWRFCVKAQTVHYCVAGRPCAPPVNAWLMHKGLSLFRELARESRRVGWFQALVNTLLGKRTERLLVQTLSQEIKIMPLHELVVAWYA